MKIAIVGSRRITNADLSAYVNDDVDMIISGGANGMTDSPGNLRKQREYLFWKYSPNMRNTAGARLLSETER